MASLDVQTASGVAKSEVIAELSQDAGVHGWITAALLQERRDLKRIASFKSFETEFRHFRRVSGKDVWRLYTLDETGKVYSVECGGTR